MNRISQNTSWSNVKGSKINHTNHKINTQYHFKINQTNFSIENMDLNIHHIINYECNVLYPDRVHKNHINNNCSWINK